jgi:magnesium-transporting ATPase (P-type)
MILGMSTAAFTTLHVIISLIGIGSGIVVALGMCQGIRLPRWTALFLLTTVLTSVTGFLFHSAAFGPPQVIGVISLIILAVAIVALYVNHLAGAARWVYIISAVLALWLNAFVGVVQAFQKLPTLHTLAPTQKEPPFFAAQLVVLALFIVIAAVALRRFPARTVRSVV